MGSDHRRRRRRRPARRPPGPSPTSPRRHPPEGCEDDDRPQGAPLTSEPEHDAEVEEPANRRLMLLLAMAMFVLVVDTSLMNVSISAVIDDLNTTASAVQGAIALEALVSAAFILINSKVGDLIGRKRAYVIGLLRLRRRRTRHDPRPERHRDHHLLGDHRRARRVPAAAGHAVAHPRQLHRTRPEAGLRPRRRRRGHRSRDRATPRRVRHHVPVVAGRLRPRGGDHRRRAVPDRPGPRRRLHRIPQGRRRRGAAVGGRHGRPGPRDPRLAGRRRDGRPPHDRRRRRPRVARLVARAPQARRLCDPDRSRPVPAPQLHRRDLRG